MPSSIIYCFVKTGRICSYFFSSCERRKWFSSICRKLHCPCILLWHIWAGVEILDTMKNPVPETRKPDFGGDGGIRTLDLTDANRTLSQLSYAPIFN